MTATVLILPVISRCSFSDDAWLEQYDRERLAAMMNELHPPPRTRPMLVRTETTGSTQRREGAG